MKFQKSSASSSLRRLLAIACVLPMTLACLPANLFSQDIGKVSSVTTTQLSGCSASGENGEYIWRFDGPQIVFEADKFPEELVAAVRNQKKPNLAITRDSTIGWEMQKTSFSINLTTEFTDNEIKKNSKSFQGSENTSARLKYKPARFSIAGSNIPRDVIKAITGRDRKVNSIEGTWVIADSTIQFSNILVNRREKLDSIGELEIYFTGVIRIESPEAQYVF